MCFHSTDPRPNKIRWHSVWHIIWNYMARIFWDSFWHSIWHLLSHSIWNSIWHLFWYSIWGSFWQVFWRLFWPVFRSVCALPWSHERSEVALPLWDQGSCSEVALCNLRPSPKWGITPMNTWGVRFFLPRFQIQCISSLIATASRCFWGYQAHQAEAACWEEVVHPLPQDMNPEAQQERHKDVLKIF